MSSDGSSNDQNSQIPPNTTSTAAALAPPTEWSSRSVLAERSVWTTVSTMLMSSSAAIGLTTILGIHVYAISKEKLDLGILGLVEFTPAAALVLFTGSVADRLDRRRVFAVSLIVEAISVCALIAYAASGPNRVWPFFLATFAFGCARAFANPALRSMMPAATPDPEALSRTLALSSSAWQIASILSPAVAAGIFTISRVAAYIFISALMVGAFAMCTFIPSAIGRGHLGAKEHAQRPTLTSALQGLVVIRRSPILFGAIALDLFAVLFGGAVALLPAIVDERLHGEEFLVGVLRTAGGIGALLVSLLLASRPIQRRVGRWLLVCVGIFGVATIGLGFTTSFVVACLAMFVLNGADAVSVFIRSTLVPIVTPPSERGRVLAVEAVFIGASNELGAFQSGVAAFLFGTVAAVVSGGAATLAIVALWWVAFPALRDIDRFEDVQGHSNAKQR